MPDHPADAAAQNTDRELWREKPGDYYAPSVHVTEGGGIGINVGGMVIVKPLREWHALARSAAAPEPGEVERLREFLNGLFGSERVQYIGRRCLNWSVTYEAATATRIKQAIYAALDGLTVARDAPPCIHCGLGDRYDECEQQLRDALAQPCASPSGRREPSEAAKTVALELRELLPQMREDAECHRTWTTDESQRDLEPGSSYLERYSPRDIAGDREWHGRWAAFYDRVASIMERAALILEGDTTPSVDFPSPPEGA